MEKEREITETGVEIPPPIQKLPAPTQKRLRRGFIIGALVFLLLVIFLVAGLWTAEMKRRQQEAAEWKTPGIPVKVTEVKPGGLVEVVEATGVIKPIQEVTVYPEVSGKVRSILADLGDEVTVGSPLVTIDDELIRLKIDQLEAQITKLNAIYEDSEKNLVRAERLYEQRGLSEMDLDQARLAAKTNAGMLEEARVALAMAQRDMRNTVVKSPVSGVLTSRFLEIGSLVSPAVPVAHLANLQKVKVEVGLIDSEVTRVAVGQKVNLRVDAYPDLEFSGLVTAVGEQADSVTLTFPVRVELDNPQNDNRLLPGMIARIYIKVGLHEDVVVVPIEVLREDAEGRWIAFVVDGTTAKKRHIILGPQEKDMVVVSSGLAPGEKLVIVGQDNLDDGVAVQIDAEE